MNKLSRYLLIRENIVSLFIDHIVEIPAGYIVFSINSREKMFHRVNRPSVARALLLTPSSLLE